MSHDREFEKKTINLLYWLCREILFYYCGNLLWIHVIYSEYLIWSEVRSTIRGSVRDSVYIKNCLLIDLFIFSLIDFKNFCCFVFLYSIQIQVLAIEI